jgi:predicted transcriptional regulator
LLIYIIYYTKDKILELRNLGYSYNKISKELNCAKSLVSYYCSKLEKNNDIIINNSIKKKSFLLNIDITKIKLVIELKNKLKTYSEIREITKLSYSTISKICREYNLTQKRKFSKVDSETISKINELYSELCSINKVSKILTLSKDTVRKYIKILHNKNEKSNIPKKIRQSNSVISWRRRSKLKLIEYKGGRCEKCGYNKCQMALEFHHLNPSEKDFTIGGKSWSFDKLKSEVDKCILVCSNCHKEIHYNEK